MDFAKGVEVDASWGTYRKKVLARAKKIEGPFTTETREGMLSCADGYLCVDTEGYPYPIDAAEFDRLYELA